MLRPLLIALLLSPATIVSVGAEPAGQPELAAGNKQQSPFVPADAVPAGDPSGQDFYESWFGPQLAAMGETPMWHDPPPVGEGYRLRILFLPTFHPAHMVRIDASDRSNAYAIITGTSGGAGGYDPGTRGASERVPLSRQGAKEIAALIQSAALAEQGFSEFSGADPADDIAICTDGLQLVFELVDAQGYHMSTRHECATRGGGRELAKKVDTLRRTIPSEIGRYWQ